MNSMMTSEDTVSEDVPEESLLDGFINLWGYDEPEDIEKPRIEQPVQRANPTRERSSDLSSSADYEVVRIGKQVARGFQGCVPTGRGCLPRLRRGPSSLQELPSLFSARCGSFGIRAEVLLQ